MAKQVLKDALILIGEFNVSGNHNQVALNYGADTPEGTAFGDSTRVMLPGGLTTAGLAAQGYWEADASTGRPDQTYFDRVGAAARPILVSPGRSAGDKAWFHDELLASYNPMDSSIGDAHTFSIDGAATGQLIGGTLMENRTETSSGNGTARNLGSVASGETLYGALFVTAASGTSPTLDVTVESDSADDFTGSETTQLTFAQQTAAGTDRQSKDGSISDTWFRVTWTIGGTSPSFTFLVALGIQ